MIKKFLFVTLGAVLLTSTVCVAQNTQTARGIEGRMDGHGRSPQLSVTRVSKGDGIVSLLVDAFNPDKEYNEFYPMEFEIFINRHSYVRQIRYPGLSGPVGADINTNEIPTPFNYVVVATSVSPNRRFSTYVSGAVYSTNLIADLSCRITLSADLAGEETTFSASDVSTSQSGDNDLVLSFTATSSSDAQIAVSGVVSVNNASNEASSTLRLVRNEVPQLVETTGEISINDEDSVESLSLSSSDGSVALNCD